MYAPIVLFVYKRLDTLKSCVASLKKNTLCADSELYIYSDAAAREEDRDKVEVVRSYVDAITGFKKLTIIKAHKNKGLANSVISGVSEIIGVHGKAIVLEDDLIVSENFLCFMNKALDYYAAHKRVLSISGFTTPIKVPASYAADIYFTKRVFSWGWATWKEKWEDIDWNVSDYASFLADKRRQKEFNNMGSDLCAMLHKQMSGKIDSWAVRWCYHQFRHQLYTVFPIHSKVVYNGFNNDATHSGLNNHRFKTYVEMKEQTDFRFSDQEVLNRSIIKQFTSHFSIPVRVYYKLFDIINRTIKSA